MFDEEDVKKPTYSISRNLEQLSVDELEAYILELQAEIKRAEQDILKKKDVFSAAESFFK